MVKERNNQEPQQVLQTQQKKNHGYSSFGLTVCVVRSHGNDETTRTNGLYSLTFQAQTGNLTKPHEIKHDYGVNKHGSREGGNGSSLWWSITFMEETYLDTENRISAENNQQITLVHIVQPYASHSYTSYKQPTCLFVLATPEMAHFFP